MGSSGKKKIVSPAASTSTSPAGRRPLVWSAVCLALVLAARPSHAFAVKPGELIDGIISRSQAVNSGRLIYTFKTRTFRGNRELSRKVFPEVTTSFFQSSWAERVKGGHRVRINHDGYFLEFVQTPQRDGSVRPGATLLPRRSLDSRLELNTPPVFAGCFWFRDQLQYAKEHAGEWRVAGSQVVNNLDTAVLELQVPAEDHGRAFHVVSPGLKSGGVMRLFVAAQLGFVLPRIEFQTNSKRIAQRYDAVGFTEVAPGIYFPKRLWTETYASASKPRFRAEFIARCELINQPIPQDDFVVELPLGTRVQDAREPGDVVTFEINEAAPSSTLPTGEPVAESLWTPIGFLDRWGNAVIVGLVIGGISSISFLLAARNQRQYGRL